MICTTFSSYYIIFPKSWRGKSGHTKPHRYIQFLLQRCIILEKHHFPVNLSLTLFFVLSTRPVNSSYPLTVILAQYYQINGLKHKEKHQRIFRNLNNYHTMCEQANKQKKKTKTKKRRRRKEQEKKGVKYGTKSPRK